MALACLETVEAREAARRAGGWDAPAEFWSRFSDVLDERDAHRQALDGALSSLGIDVDEFLEHVHIARVVQATHEAQKNSKRQGGLCEEAREITRELFHNAVRADVIARILEVPETVVTSYVHERKANPNETAVMGLHREGKTPSEIKQLIGVPESTARKIITGKGGQPHRKLNRVPDYARLRVIELRNHGASRSLIRAETGLRPYQVDNVLRQAAKKGMLRSYNGKERT